MSKTVWIFGLIAGGILSAMMLLTLPFMDESGNALLLGYATMVGAFLLIYFGVRQYRDNVGNGSVSFGRAMAIGALITVVASACYVATWEALYFGKPNFAEKFDARMMESAKKKATNEAEAAKAEADMKKFADMYKNPAINSAMTFIEPLPVGLIMALVAAGLLRRRKDSPA